MKLWPHMSTLGLTFPSSVMMLADEVIEWRGYKSLDTIDMNLRPLIPLFAAAVFFVAAAYPKPILIRAVHHFGKFISEQDAIDCFNAHPRLTKPEDTMD